MVVKNQNQTIFSFLGPNDIFVFIGFTFGTPQYPSTDVPPQLSSLFRTCTFKGSNARNSFATEYGAARPFPGILKSPG